MQLPFAGETYRHRSLRVDAQECVNFYVEKNLPNAKSPTCLITTPGMRKYADISGGDETRGLHTTAAGDRLFIVSGGRLIEILRGGGSTVRGELMTRHGRVAMADNGLQLIISDGQCGYCYNMKSWKDQLTGRTFTEGSFTKIVDGDITFTIGGDTTTVVSEFPKCSHIAFKDGFFVANKVGTGALFVSRYYDGTIWDASQYAIAESMPDNVSALCSTHNVLWVLGPTSSEAWFTSGQAAFPFARVQGAYTDIGIHAPLSLATDGIVTYWLAGNKMGNNSIYATATYTPERISTHAIEYMLDRMARTDDAIGFCYQQEGHRFYVISFPSGNKTLCYDQTTGLWHERAAWSKQYGKFNRHAAIAHGMFDRKNIIAVYNDSALYSWCLDLHDDNGEEIRSVRTFPHISVPNKRIVYRRLSVDMETGTALQMSSSNDELPTQQTGIIQNDMGSEPQLMLQWSDDGGYTWSDELWGSIGRVGQYRKRVMYHNLGSGYDRVFRFVYTDKLPAVLLSAVIDAA